MRRVLENCDFFLVEIAIENISFTKDKSKYSSDYIQNMVIYTTFLTYCILRPETW